MSEPNVAISGSASDGCTVIKDFVLERFALVNTTPTSAAVQSEICWKEDTRRRRRRRMEWWSGGLTRMPGSVFHSKWAFGPLLGG